MGGKNYKGKKVTIDSGKFLLKSKMHLSANFCEQKRKHFIFTKRSYFMAMKSSLIPTQYNAWLNFFFLTEKFQV